MTDVLLLDIDNTLTDPRTPITEEMVSCLNNLAVQFHVVAGSHLDILIEQFFSPMYKYGYKGDFLAFPCNGSATYSCSYTSLMHIKKKDIFSLYEHLGKEKYNYLVENLYTLIQGMPGELSNGKNILVDRVSMINLAPAGRDNTVTAATKEHRDKFVEFDKRTGYRLETLNKIKEFFADLIEEKDLLFTLGGQTSFDICVKGEDKSKAVDILRGEDKRIMFVGDALYDNGNDSAIKDYMDTYDCNGLYKQVDSYHETLDFLKENYLWKRKP